MNEWFERDFVFVVGKGGVGKSTVSAAMAMNAAARGKRVLLAMCNAKENLGAMLELGPIDTTHRTIFPGVEAVNMTPDQALEEYGLMVLKVRALHQAIFGNRLVTAFLHGTPGIDAWAMLGKAYFHAVEKDSVGRKRYDLVILDAPATGHALDMLRVPKVLTEVAPPGLLRREAENAITLFQDPRRTAAVLVTLPEDMPTNETIDLHRVLSDELRIQVERVVVNRVEAELFAPAEETTVMASATNASAVNHPILVAARRRVSRTRVQRECLARLAAAITAPRTDLPNLPTRALTRASLQALATRFSP